MDNSYFIRICSQKGGVGKSTVAVNLAVALSGLNYRVLIMDQDFMSPAVGFFLGMEDVNKGIREVMDGKADLKSSIIRYEVTGLDVLPGTQAPRGSPSAAQLNSLVKAVRALNAYDFVIQDTQPGYMPPEIARLDDEALIITTPSMVSVISSIKQANIYNKQNVRNNLLINRMTNKKYELSVSEIDDAYESKSLAALPEDPQVPISESHHIPIMVSHPHSQFCTSLNTLVRFYASKKGGGRMGRGAQPQPGPGFLSGLVGAIRGLLSGRA